MRRAHKTKMIPLRLEQPIACVYLSNVQLLLSSGLSLNLQDDKASNPNTSGTTSSQSPSETRAAQRRLLIKSISRRFPPSLSHPQPPTHPSSHTHTQRSKQTLSRYMKLDSCFHLRRSRVYIYMWPGEQRARK